MSTRVVSFLTLLLLRGLGVQLCVQSTVNELNECIKIYSAIDFM